MSTVQRNVNQRRLTRAARTGQRVFTSLHSVLYRLSGGAIGGRFRKSPVLLLKTVGRKTGKERTTPLLYLKDGDTFVLVASNGGAPTHPTWWLNLQAHPDAEVEVGRQHIKVRTRAATAEERQRLWPLLVAMYADYAVYQQKTSREIPVVLLSPLSAQTTG